MLALHNHRGGYEGKMRNVTFLPYAPDAFEVACMYAAEESIERLSSPEARERVAKWLADKYVGRG